MNGKLLLTIPSISAGKANTASLFIEPLINLVFASTTMLSDLFSQENTEPSLGTGTLVTNYSQRVSSKFFNVRSSIKDLMIFLIKQLPKPPQERPIKSFVGLENQ